MKRIILGVAIIVLNVITVFAQKKINEGIITYKVEWQPAPQMQQFAAMFPKEVTVYFKGDSAVTVVKAPFFNSNTIVNAKTEYQRLLLDMPMRNKKFSVIFTPDDIEQMKEHGPEFSMATTTENKVLNGYKAIKSTITEKKSGKTADGWFTNDIEIPQNSLTIFFNKSAGFPLEFSSFQSGMGLKATVADIKETAVPVGIFSATKDYEEITFAQLMAMMGGGNR